MKITLANLHEATKQEVFDQVADHLLTQVDRSQFESGQCAYRGEKGRMCAAGCLIADDEYEPHFDYGGEGELDSQWSTLVRHNLVPSQHVDLISDLQRVHDSSYYQVPRIFGLYSSLKDVAELWRLDDSVVKNHPNIQTLV